MFKAPGTHGQAVLFLINIVQLLIFFATALIPSILGALSGIGGGIIIKPVLDAFSPFTIEEINFLSGCTVLAMSFVSLLQNFTAKDPAIPGRGKSKKLDDRHLTILALGAILGGTLGETIFSAAVSSASRKWVGIIQSGILTFLCAIIMIYMIRKESIKPKDIQNRPFCFLLGLAMGMVSVFLGIGGGPVNIMLIAYFLGADSKTTGLYSLYVIFLSQLANFLSTLVSGRIPPVPFMVLAVMISGGIGGGLIGSKILRRLENKHVDILFRYILAGVILLSGYNIYRLSREFF